MSVRKGQKWHQTAVFKEQRLPKELQSESLVLQMHLLRLCILRKRHRIALCLKKCVYNSPFWAHMDEFIPYIKISVSEYEILTQTLAHGIIRHVSNGKPV